MLNRCLALVLFTACATDVEDLEELDHAALTGTNTSLAKYTVRIGDCSGILLNPRWILTTAQCIGTPGSQSRTISYAPTAGAMSTIYSGIVQTYAHPDFEASTFDTADHNVGLIHLYDRGIDMAGLGIPQPPLYDDPKIPGIQGSEDRTAQLVGWGNVKPTCAGSSNVLRITPEFELNDLADSFAHQGVSPGRPTCSADRGGPLLVNRGGVNLVTSLFSDFLGTPNTWSYFAVLRYNFDWIEETIASRTSYAYDTGTWTYSAAGYPYKYENIIARPAGSVVTLAGGCLQYDSATNQVTTQPCRSTEPKQDWFYTTLGALRTTEPTPRCLSNQVTLLVAPCDTTSQQRFYVDNDNHVKSATAGRCLHFNGLGATVDVTTCSADTPYLWRIVN